MSSNHHAKIVRAVRERLSGYGVSKDESIVDALDNFHNRLVGAEKIASDLGIENDQLRAEAKLARETRDAAQESATQAVLRERVATFENRALRSIFESILSLISSNEMRIVIDAVREADEKARALASEYKVKRLDDEMPNA